MRKSLWIMLAVMVVAVSAPNVHADTVSTFNVTGTAENVSSPLGTCAVDATCAFSGTLMIDVTKGFITAVDITFPGLDSFTNLVVQLGDGQYFFAADQGFPFPRLALVFSTGGSLVGFSGGSFSCPFNTDPTTSECNVFNLAEVFYTSLNGSITPATMAAPEPSSVALMLLGVGLVLLLRKRNSRGHQLAT